NQYLGDWCMKKKIIYVDFTKKRRINFFHFTFNKMINYFTNRTTISNSEIPTINTNNKALVNKIY
ncbi:MAG: hypothetical protein E6X86_17800, partial [Clostridium butyricum]|nr:hypothetical protein [Clostridium butyricum]